MKDKPWYLEVVSKDKKKYSKAALMELLAEFIREDKEVSPREDE